MNLTLQKFEKRASQGGYCLVVTKCFAVVATINISVFCTIILPLVEKQKNERTSSSVAGFFFFFSFCWGELLSGVCILCGVLCTFRVLLHNSPRCWSKTSSNHSCLFSDSTVKTCGRYNIIKKSQSELQFTTRYVTVIVLVSHLACRMHSFQYS